MIVEDGTGVANADSYVSVTEADTFMTNDFHSNATWSALTTSQKETLLIQATRLLDQMFKWKGKKAKETNSLRFPRSEVLDRDGYTIPDNEIPIELRLATTKYAVIISQEDREAENSSMGISEMRVDVIGLKFDKNDRKDVVPKSVKNIVGFLADGTIETNIFGRIEVT